MKHKPKSDWRPTDLKMPEVDQLRAYRFKRDLADNAYIVVTQDGTVENYDVRHIIHHSPTGMEFGYNGSGPADCARSILADCIGLPLADMLYQKFKSKFVGPAQIDTVIHEIEIREWAKHQIDACRKKTLFIEEENSETNQANP